MILRCDHTASIPTKSARESKSQNEFYCLLKSQFTTLLRWKQPPYNFPHYDVIYITVLTQALCVMNVLMIARCCKSRDAESEH